MKNIRDLVKKVFSRIPNYVGISLVFLLLGLPLLFLGSRSLLDQLKIRNWPVVTGKVISLDTFSYFRESKFGSYTVYEPEILYQYQVGGRNYTSDRIYLSGKYQTSSFYELKFFKKNTRSKER